MRTRGPREGKKQMSVSLREVQIARLLADAIYSNSAHQCLRHSTIKKDNIDWVASVVKVIERQANNTFECDRR